ncbi:MAG: dTDP-glucose 4,6-dehydratase [Rickettsiales bacterium]|nr:dTDP-glucose 4,6-dehydratase [Rickettsiales bacterium]
MLNPNTLLVTGGAGFIGSTFVGQCVARGQKVIVLDKLTYAGHPENLSWVEGEGSYELIEGDICDGPLISELLAKHNVDALVHFAAESHVDNSIASPSEFIQTNINGSYTLLEAARQYWNGLSGDKKDQFRFVQISTDEVYGSLGKTGKFSEETSMKPNSPYSASKAAGDHLARAWFHTYGLPTIVTNCTNNYGPRQHPEKLIPLMTTFGLSGRNLPVYGDGTNIRDWIHVEDHCSGVYLALTKGTPGETYCFGGDAERNNLDVVKTICATLQELVPTDAGYEHLITFVEDRAGHDWRYAIDDSKAESTLGFTRKYQFESGLRATIQWYLDNKQWCEAITQKKAAA